MLRATAVFLFLFLLMFASPVAASSRMKTAILVDKKTNTLRLMKYVNGAYEPVKSYHATLGKVTGDKVTEGDLKTPEGIYTFNTRLTPPTLKPKFGKMAFYLNFPNDFDRIAGYTGSDIMLHATNEPERLKQNYDSEGCIVVNNEEISEIHPFVRVGLTPILVFDELKEEYLKPGQSAELKAFFESWIQAWESKAIDSYISHYHSDFSAQQKDKNQWKVYKANLNSRYKTIQVGPEDVQYYRHPKYSMITFTQNYRSALNRGGVGHRSRGTKILYIAEEAGQPKIISETYTTLMW
ncbi:MAG: L,D-transpeptidase family protein [Oligoflexia bacterium]|nr:L,D-transpeptidase family protein [Oligoflexia bacterium]